MNISIVPVNNSQIAIIHSEKQLITVAQDAMDILGNCYFQGADSIILRAEHFHPDFFDLKTGLAGEILQKFSNYRSRLAIVGNFSNISSKSLRDFIYESNKLKQINFVATQEQAIVLFSSK